MRRKGFTLIELVMVIVIIGILAAVAIPKFMSLQEEAKRARCEADVGAFRTGISGWYAKFHANGTCPSGVSSDCTKDGFPENISTTAFINFTFANNLSPSTSHIMNGTSWNAHYSNTTGVINMAECCNSSEP